MKRKKYAMAISFSRSAEDWIGLGRIVDSVMEEYIVHGELSMFRMSGPSMFTDVMSQDHYDMSHSLPISRLPFKSSERSPALTGSLSSA